MNERWQRGVPCAPLGHERVERRCGVIEFADFARRERAPPTVAALIVELIETTVATGHEDAPRLGAHHRRHVHLIRRKRILR